MRREADKTVGMGSRFVGWVRERAWPAVRRWNWVQNLIATLKRKVVSPYYRRETLKAGQLDPMNEFDYPALDFVRRSKTEPGDIVHNGSHFVIRDIHRLMRKIDPTNAAPTQVYVGSRALPTGRYEDWVDERGRKRRGDRWYMDAVMTKPAMNHVWKRLARDNNFTRFKELREVDESVVDHLDESYWGELAHMVTTFDRANRSGGLVERKNDYKGKSRRHITMENLNPEIFFKLFENFVERSTLGQGTVHIFNMTLDADSPLETRFKVIKIFDTGSSYHGRQFIVPEDSPVVGELREANNIQAGYIVSHILLAAEHPNEAKAGTLRDDRGNVVDGKYALEDLSYRLRSAEDRARYRSEGGPAMEVDIVNPRMYYYDKLNGRLYYTKGVISQKEMDDNGWAPYKINNLPNVTPGQFPQLLNNFGTDEKLRQHIHARLVEHPNLSLWDIANEKSFGEGIKPILWEWFDKQNRLEVPEDVFKKLRSVFGGWQGRWWTIMRERVDWSMMDPIRDELDPLMWNSESLLKDYDFKPGTQEPDSWGKRKARLGSVLATACRDDGDRSQRLMRVKNALAEALVPGVGGEPKYEEGKMHQIAERIVDLIDEAPKIKQFLSSHNFVKHGKLTGDNQADFGGGNESEAGEPEAEELDRAA